MGQEDEMCAMGGSEASGRGQAAKVRDAKLQAMFGNVGLPAAHLSGSFCFRSHLRLPSCVSKLYNASWGNMTASKEDEAG